MNYKFHVDLGDMTYEDGTACTQRLKMLKKAGGVLNMLEKVAIIAL